MMFVASEVMEDEYFDIPNIYSYYKTFVANNWSCICKKLLHVKMSDTLTRS